MPIYHYECDECGEALRRLQTPSEARRGQVCPHCGEPMGRAATGPSARVVERLDNGAMPRALERLSEAERLFRERAKGKPPV